MTSAGDFRSIDCGAEADSKGNREVISARFGALQAAWTASADFRRLDRMTDQQLRMHRLSRSSTSGGDYPAPLPPPLWSPDRFV